MFPNGQFAFPAQPSPQNSGGGGGFLFNGGDQPWHYTSSTTTAASNSSTFLSGMAQQQQIPNGQQQQPLFPFQRQPQQVITVALQYGPLRELLIVERTPDPGAFEMFRQKARQMVERQLKFEANANPGASNGVAAGGQMPMVEIQLFLHDYKSFNVLTCLGSLDQLDNGSVVEIVRLMSQDEKPTRPHALAENSYVTPTFCDYCGEILLGLIKQGLQCQLCKCNFHKRCAHAPRNNCAKADLLVPTTFLAGAGQYPVGGEDTNGPSAQQPHFQLPHTLMVHNYKTPTVCKVCDKLLFGVIKQGLRCRDCKVNVHRKCAALLEKNCHIPAENAIVPSLDQISIGGGAELTEMTNDQPQQTDTSTDAMIPLARLPGSASSRSVRHAAGQPVCEGWLIHFLLQDRERRRLRHYWVLANGLICLYNEYNDGVNVSRVFRQIQLAEIIALIPYEGPSLDPKFPPHAFEIRTASGLTFCAGENLEALGGGGVPTANYSALSLSKSAARQFGGGGAVSWQQWFQALQQSLQPPPLRTDPGNAEPALQFTQLYQVHREKVLGSGQFGTVYSGVHRQSGREVAVKVIAKDRFSKKSSAVETLKSEVAILQAVDHQGIIKLEAMFETKDKIFVVMEKMDGDMLEMILSQASGRLNERCTKFLIMQILSALHYLHSRGIAHCDLKPENVLLSDFQSNFPQTKLCDFGYARFIGETQFRKTIVGTPAYLAPEVLKRKGYNKSLDMWSVGVIVYVTLSGTFPFNENEEIAEQIQNAEFMFPSNPWGEIHSDAIDLIQRLLRVQIEERLTIDECIAHGWLKDPQTYWDLLCLEKRLGLGRRYLTSEAEDLVWAEQLAKMGLLEQRQQPQGTTANSTLLLTGQSTLEMDEQGHIVDLMIT